MALETKIPWCDATWNPWMGCSAPVSEACDNCYACAAMRRFGRDPRKPELAKNPWRVWKSWRGKRVFVGSWMDFFDPCAKPEWRDQTMTLMESLPDVTFLILTKHAPHTEWADPKDLVLPKNVWLGVTIEKQRYVEPRLEWLKRQQAGVRFVSAEPLLEPVDFGEYLKDGTVNWVIVGGEGRGGRMMQHAWADSIAEDCQHAGVKYFFKQRGRYWEKHGPTSRLQCEVVREFPS